MKTKSDTQEVKMDKLLRQHLMENSVTEISLSDILNTEEYKTRCSDGSCGEEVLEEFLWMLGLDTEKEYEQQFLPHRNMRGEVVSCARWVGSVRTDSEWLEFLRTKVEKYQNV